MAVTLDVKIKPYTDASEVRKIANELSNSLEKELNKHSNDKDFMGLNSRAKNSIQTLRKLEQELEDLSNKQFKSKFANQIEKAEDALVNMRFAIKQAQKDLNDFANTDAGKAVAERLKIEYESIEKSLNTNLDNAVKNANRAKMNATRYRQEERNSESWTLNLMQDLETFKKRYEEAKKYYAKHKALMDRGEDKSTAGVLAARDLETMPKYIRQTAKEILVAEQETERWAKKAKEAEEILAEAETKIAPAQKARDDFLAKRDTEIAGKITESPEYQQAQQNLDNLIAKEREQAQVVSQLYQQESEAEAQFAESVAVNEEKIYQAMDKTSDQMKVELVQYQKAGKDLPRAIQIAIPAFNALGHAIRTTLGLVPGMLHSIVRGLSRLTTIIHLPKISGSLRDIFRQVKRGTTLILGMILGARGLQSIFNKFRTSFLSGFKDIYNQDEKFKTQIDTIKQKILDIQVALAKSLMPVIQLALPYIKQILDWVLSLLGTLQRFISTVTGIQAYTKAIKGLGGAAQNANKQLSKLDELNNYSDSGNGLTPNDMSIGEPQIKDWFTFVRNIIDEIEKLLRGIPWDEVYKKAEKFGQQMGLIINAIFKPSFWNAVGETLAGVFNTILHFFNSLGNTIWFEEVGKSIFQGITGFLDKFDWGLLQSTLATWADGFWTIIKTVLTERGETGETLAERIVRMITTSLSMINWQEVYAKVQEVATTLAETLNQLIDPSLAHQIGRTLGGVIMSIVKFAIAFFGEGGLDWKNLGDTIASGINGFFEQFDGAEMAKGINAFFNGVLTAIKQIISKVDWEEVWSDFKALLTGVDWKAMLTVLIPLIAPTLGKIALDILKTVWDLVKKPLLNFLKTSVWPEIQAFFKTIFSNLPGFFNTVGGFITTVLELLIEFLGIWQIVAGLGESIALLFGGDFLGASADEWQESSPIAWIIKALTGSFDSEAWDEVWFEFFDGIVNFFTKKIPELWEVGKDIADGVLQGIAEFAKKGFTLTALFDAIVNAVKSIFGIASPAKEMYSIGEDIVLGILEGFNLVDFAQKMTEWWNLNVAPWFTLDKWTEAVTNIKNAVVNVWTSARTWWSENVQSWWTNNVAPWFTFDKWTELLNPIKDAFSSVFKSAANLVIDILNNIIGALEGLMNNGIAGLVNSIGDKINSKLSADKQIPTFSNITLPRIPGLASGTVIPPSMGEFIARLGDNNSQTEIVSPLDTMKQAFLEAMESSGGFGGEIHIHVDVDGRQLTEVVVEQNELRKKSTGGRGYFA